MIYDLHVHSKYSHDSVLEPKTILKIAKKREMDGVAVTDHNTIKGGLETLKLNKDKDFQVIVGAEIRTEYGDIVGLFLDDDIANRRFEDTIEEIKKQGGLSVLAHPFRRHQPSEKMLNQVDLVEAFNARSQEYCNAGALALSKKHNLSIVGGSDAHLSFEIGRGKTIVYNDLNDIPSSLIKGYTVAEGIESNYRLVHGLSFAIEYIKRFL